MIGHLSRDPDSAFLEFTCLRPVQCEVANASIRSSESRADHDPGNPLLYRIATDTI